MRSIVGMTAALAAFSWASVASADERKFTYSYEAKTLPKGTWEFEQWATMKMEKEAGDFNRLDLREEFEYGFTDRLTAAFYLNTRYQATRGVPGLENEHFYELDSVSNAWRYKISDPSADLVGIALYGEVTAAPGAYDLEAKLLLSKHVGPFTLAYNFIYEAELERDAGESPEWRWAHVVQNTAGISYSLPFLERAAVGVEARSEMHFARSLTGDSNSAYYVGPNVHYAAGAWWATLTFLRQINVNGLDFQDSGYTKYEVRLIFGINF